MSHGSAATLESEDFESASNSWSGVAAPEGILMEGVYSDFLKATSPILALLEVKPSPPPAQVPPQGAPRTPQPIPVDLKAASPNPSAVAPVAPATKPPGKDVVSVVPVATAAAAARAAEKKKIKKKLDLAKRFNLLVKEVDSLLEDAMKKIKTDRLLFRKAVVDGKKKTISLKHQMVRARRHAHGDFTKIKAIETHMAL